MTQNELLEHIKTYLLTNGFIKNEDRYELKVITSQALAWINGLGLWVRERNDIFLPTTEKLKNEN